MTNAPFAATCQIEVFLDGFYFKIITGDQETDWTGPYDTEAEAEAAFFVALNKAVIEFVKQGMGL